MNQLAKFTFKTLAKPAQVDPIERRREKIIAAIEVQKLVLAGAIKGETFTVPAKTEGKSAKAVRPWWIAGDNGFYVQCRYGSRAILLNGKENAVFVPTISDVSAALTAFAAAAKAGELDKAIAAVAEKTKS